MHRTSPYRKAMYQLMVQGFGLIAAERYASAEEHGELNFLEDTWPVMLLHHDAEHLVHTLRTPLLLKAPLTGRQ